MPDKDSKQMDKMLRKFEQLTEMVTQMATPEAVHDLRTSSRRIQTMVQAHQLEDKGPAGKLLKQLHRLRSRAGKVRDIDVQLLALETIPESSNGDRQKVQDYLRQSRAKQAAKLANKADSELGKKLMNNIAKVGTLLETSGDVDADHFLRDGLDQFAQIAEQYSNLDENNLHEFRKECKHARYTLEMAGDSKKAEQAIDLLKEIQDKVGDWHDWVNLTGSVQKVGIDSNSALMKAVQDGRQARLDQGFKTARESTKALLALRSKPAAREKGTAKAA